MIMDRDKEIRAMLDRWYGGISTPEEERRLLDFFASDMELPPDLEEERILFRAIAGTASEDVELPGEVARRIEETLDAEMSRKHAAVPMFAVWRRRFMAACGVAAVCLAVTLTVRLFVADKNNSPAQEAGLTVNRTVSTESVVPKLSDTAIIKLPENYMPALIAEAPEAKHRGKPVKANRGNSDKVAEVSEYEAADEGDDDDMYLSEEEEERLVACHYRVIKDEREADALLGSLFVILENNLNEGSALISDIDRQYEINSYEVFY